MSTSAATMTVFVTTDATFKKEDFSGGKWAVLNDYSDKSTFIAAMEDYKVNVLGDVAGELRFLDWESDFSWMPNIAIYKLIDNESVDERLWQLLDKPTLTLEVLDAYLGIQPLKNESFSETIALAEEVYVGYYKTEEEWAEHYYALEFQLMPQIIRKNVNMKQLGKDAGEFFRVSRGHYFRKGRSVRFK